jgi:hypothetical protein
MEAVSLLTSENNPFPLQFGVAKIEDQRDRQSGDAEIIDHLPPLMISDSIDDLRVDDHFASCNQIGNIFTDLDRCRLH